ncbi:hypothetical protein [Spirillospora sp. NPDC047279]|uniref:hypothetical protein n=1 Tax=Spirillospora sp. NPDC047279 TaxID=3155478 RepID=UPI0033E667D0
MTENVPLNDDERAELERLRTEVGRLREERTPHGAWRRPRAILATILIVVGCLLAPLGALAVWTSNEISNTDRYVENVAPLASDPVIQNAIIDRTTNEIMLRLDVQAILAEVIGALEQRGLPPRAGDRLEGLAGPIGNGVRGFVRDQIAKIVQSQEFVTLWSQANRLAHTQLNAVLSGEGGELLRVNQGSVSIDLGPLIELVKQRLVSAGLSVAASIPAVHPTFPLFESSELAKAQSAYDMLNTLKWVLPIMALLFVAAGVYVARGKRNALIGAGIGVALGMFALAIGIAIGRAAYLDAVGDAKLNTTAAAVLFDTLVRFLRAGLRTIFVLALVVAAGAYLSGPAPAAVRLRAFFTRSFARVRRTGEGHGVTTGPVGRWMYSYRTLLRCAAVALAALMFLLWDQPTGKVVLFISVLLVLLLAVIELLSRPPAATPPAATAT